MVLQVVEVVLGEEDAARAAPHAVHLPGKMVILREEGGAAQLLGGGGGGALAVGLAVETVRTLLLQHGRR